MTGTGPATNPAAQNQDRKGDLDGAAAAFREAIRLRPDFVEAHRNLRNVLRRKGDLDGAESAGREVLRLSPADAEAAGFLAELAAERSWLPEATWTGPSSPTARPSVCGRRPPRPITGSAPRCSARGISRVRPRPAARPSA